VAIGTRPKRPKFFGSFFQKRTEEDFFFEKKKQKTFDCLASAFRAATEHIAGAWTKRV
jgi:hypothetical protein